MLKEVIQNENIWERQSFGISYGETIKGFILLDIEITTRQRVSYLTPVFGLIIHNGNCKHFSYDRYTSMVS